MKTIEPSSNLPASSNVELSSRFGSICWLNMIASGSSDQPQPQPRQPQPQSPVEEGKAEKAAANDDSMASHDPNNCCTKWIQKLVTVLKWVFNDFRMRHLVWIKFIFFFQSASMTVLYPYLNLHMKSLGLDVQEVAVINAIIPILFIFTPPLAGFMAEKSGKSVSMLIVVSASSAVSVYLL